MTLREAILALIPEAGVDVARIYCVLAREPRESIDQTLGGLIRAGRVIRTACVLRLAVEPQRIKCKVCAGLKTDDELLDMGICMPCASSAYLEADAAAAAQRRAAAIICNCCGEPKPVGSFTDARRICSRCIGRQRVNAETQRKRGKLRAEGKTRDGVPSWKTIADRMTKMESAPRVALSSGLWARSSPTSPPR